MAIQIIVVDDDPIVGTLTYELLQEAGFSVLLIQDSLKALDEIKKEKPQLVLIDILMPGIDGLTLLHRIKTDPETSKVRAIIVSGKSFAQEKARALQYGAEMFLEKPYDVDTFGQKIGELLGTSKAAAASLPATPAAPTPAPSTPAPVPAAKIELTIWGGRAAPDAPAAASAGKHTPCVSVRLPKHLLIFDAGSGLIPLGESIVREGRFKELWMFLTHFHPGHVEGLAKFPCARDASFTLNVSGASDPDKPFEGALAEALKPGFGSSAPPCRIELYELIEQTYEILPGVRLTVFFANHPGTTLGYALYAEGRKIVYCPDSELYGESGTALQDYDEKLGGLVKDADLLLHDARFTDEDYKANRNTGHSSFVSTIDFAARNKIKHLVLVHQDARYDDAALAKMAQDAEKRVAEKGYALKVEMGREGLKIAY